MGTLLYGNKVDGIYMEDSASSFLEMSLDLEFLWILWNWMWHAPTTSV